MSCLAEPDLAFLVRIVMPQLKSGKDWLSSLLLHAEERKLCSDMYCSPCKRPFRNYLYLILNATPENIKEKADLYDRSDHLFPETPFLTKLSTDCEALIDGLRGIDFISIEDTATKYSLKPKRRTKKTTNLACVGDYFEDDLHGNKLRQLIYFLWSITEEYSLHQFGGRYELLNRRWVDTLVGEEFKIMQAHYAAKRARISAEYNKQYAFKLKKKNNKKDTNQELAKKIKAIANIKPSKKIKADEAEKWIMRSAHVKFGIPLALDEFGSPLTNLALRMGLEIDPLHELLDNMSKNQDLLISYCRDIVVAMAQYKRGQLDKAQVLEKIEAVPELIMADAQKLIEDIKVGLL